MINTQSQIYFYSKGRRMDNWCKTDSRWFKINLKGARCSEREDLVCPDEGWVFWREAVEREASIRSV